MIDFEKMVEILNGNNKKPFDVNYLIAFNSIKYDFLANHVSRKESIKSRLFQLNANLPKIEDYPYSSIMIQYPYSNIPGISAMQDSMKEYLNRSKLWKKQDAFKPEDRKEYFDAIQRPEIAVLNKAIYLFPFFLSRLRRNHWGVIDYGNHRAIGIVLASESELKNKHECNFFSYLDQNHKYKITSPDPDYNQITENGHWIDDLILSIKFNKGKLITVSGYLFNELIPLMFIDTKNSTALNLLSENSHVIYPHDALHYSGNELEEYNNILKKYKNDIKKKESRNIDSIEETQFRIHFKMVKKFNADIMKKSAIIFDLSYNSMIKFIIKELKITTKVIETHHYLDIIVGIGFSLPAFEKLVKNEIHWNELKRIALKNLLNEDEKLRKIGIQLDLLN